MKQSSIAFSVLFLLYIFVISCQQKPIEPQVKKTDSPKPKNIILLIGDGMGLSQISATQYYNDGFSNFDRFPTIGLIKNSSATHVITDSAAGATAFSCGIKTKNRTVGVDLNMQPVETITETLFKQGYATGLIATSPITDATPASFYAHVSSRYVYEEIAAFLPNSNLDFFAGGGRQYFNKRKDSINMLDELVQHGYQVDTLNLPKKSSEKKHAILLADLEMPRISERGDFLIEASKLALEKLSKNDTGYFLMVESSLIDWACHDQEVDYFLEEQLDFDKTVGAILDFVKEDKETLLIVTADHETGAFALAMEDNDYDKITPTLYSDDHSATMIPVFTYGPGAELFAGVYENNEIYHKMMQLLQSE